MSKQQSRTEIMILRQIARHMVLVDGFSKKDTAKKLNVTPKSISNWAIRYKWHDELSKEVKEIGGLNVFMVGFFRFIELNTGKKQAQQVKEQWEAYKEKFIKRP